MKAAQFDALPPLKGDSEHLDLGWHALNYRTAATPHAQAMWEELERYVHEWGLACYQAGLERASSLCVAQSDHLDGEGWRPHEETHAQARGADKCFDAIYKELAAIRSLKTRK